MKKFEINNRFYSRTEKTFAECVSRLDQLQYTTGIQTIGAENITGKANIATI